MERPVGPRNAWLRLGTSFFRHLPAWHLFYIGVYSHLTFLISFNPPRRDWAWLYIAPEALVLFYFYCYFKAQPRLPGRRRKLAGVFALQVAAFLAVCLLAEPAPFAQDVASWNAALARTTIPPPAGTTIAWFAGRDTFIWLYEITSLFWNILIILYVLREKGKGSLMLFYGAGLLFGMTLESNGVMLKYFFEYGYHVYLPPFHAPLVTMFNWAAVFFVCAWLWHAIQAAFPALRRMRWFWGAPAIAVLGLMIDLPIEPAATQLTLWVWNSALRSGPQILGVPLLNYVSWFFAVGTFGAFYLYLTRDARGEYVYARGRPGIGESSRRAGNEGASARRRAPAWIAAVPEKMRDRPLRRAVAFWGSDKGRWTPLARNLVMILLIPVMHLVAGLGILAATLIIEGWDSPVFSILRQR
ncbi:MAG: hypothetical protein JW742_00925 [Candidatus Aminicenantes bacterium]|nr:hypothetical protein [Candidatus Aminicenantes bacterium]